MTGLSVVVANAGHEPEATGRCLAALAHELDRARDEVLWVDRAGAEPTGDEVARVVRAEPDASRGDLYRLGLDAASRPVVVLTDSATVVQPGWRQGLAEAIESGASIVSGPVVPGRPKTWPCWAGFLVEYAPHAVPPFATPAGDVSGNNVAYVREVLPTAGAGPVWKSEVNASLRARGIHPVVVPTMRAASFRRYRLHDLLGMRFRHGRHYAAVRASEWSHARRGAAAVAAVALPLLLVARLVTVVRRDRVLAAWLLVTLPLVIGAFVMWSAGEAVGYLTREGRSRGIF